MTHCIVIDREIATATCPLAQGQCFWAHRQTNLCTWSNHAPENHVALAKWVGLEPIQEQALKDLTQELKTALLSKE